MDTPDLGVVKDSQQESEQGLPLYTPRSAGFGSPIATQQSYTNPRRSQVRQIAKASFLDDDDETGEGADEQHNNNVRSDQRDPYDNPKNSDATASEPDLSPDGESYDGGDVFVDYSPTPRGSQAALLPPQSAQPVPIPRSSRTDSSDPFSAFEELKKHPTARVTSKKPSQQNQSQKPELARHSMTAGQGKRGATTNDTAPRPKTAARKALANSKVKLSALELDEETEPARPPSHGPQECDYSLPTSNSSSPATSPAKKKPASKRTAARKAEPKANARGAKKESAAPVKQTTAPSAGRTKQAKAASAPSYHTNPDGQRDGQEDEDENMEVEDEFSGLKQVPREEETREMVNVQSQEPSSPANEEGDDHIIISSDSTSSFPESDNTDDEDFECTRKMTPANARRRTRAAAAQSQARKEAATKVKDNSARASSSQRPDVKDNSHQQNSGAVSKAQPRKPTNKAAPEKPNGAAAPAKPTSEPAKEIKSSKAVSSKTMSSKMWSPTEEPKETSSIAGRRSAANLKDKDNSQVKQDTVAPSNTMSARNGKMNEFVEESKPVKPSGSSVRKPNIVAFGPGGPKNNGKSHRTTANADLRSKDQPLDLSNGGHPAPKKTRVAKESPSAPTTHLKTTVKSEGSPSENSESDQSGSGHHQPSGGRVLPSHATILEAHKNATVVRSDVETTESNYETEWADATDTLVIGDAEDSTLVENEANVVAHSQDHQGNGAAHDFGNRGREVLEPLPQNAKYPRVGGHRNVLGEVDANSRSIPKDAPTGLPYLTKRKVRGFTFDPETGLQYGDLPTMRVNWAALPSESDGPPMKRARYSSDRPVRVHEDAGYDSNSFGGLDSLSRGPGSKTGNGISGPRREGKPIAPSAFAQRLLNNKLTDRGPGQFGPVASAPSDPVAIPQRRTAPFNHPTKARSGAQEVMPKPVAKQQMNDMSKRMRAALESEDTPASNPLVPGDQCGKTSVLGEMEGHWPNNTFEQSKTSELEERARAWKKATEPYAESLGETMHKIVNVSRNIWCNNRSSLAN